ncbi:hypothetical protein BOX15_Mlig002881g3 [Macrostomum lignano]|uniref:MFS domain-containing protein n=2 Tax=Macrostomum lignano TaxID=282301 RepID=A0A1I8JH56_9PLAT|nr:hypothetical protein BOX15_Mlig002881g2 [Macrostomum lignano]PAA68966.1 hypothetical protein BOX15_Mlig002881g1 [Macrostomum lignano]PAA75673.1 hypothetical protein BOX15_Mlig002881g3 [Macrostomum lignano]
MNTKRRLTYLMIALYFFLSGVEYAVILPTMWLYIHETFGATSAFLGLMLSAFSISDLFCSPIYGRISDKYRCTKYLVIFSNLWEIGGNIMYFMGISLPFLLCSRFVTGVGAGAGAAIVSDIARATNVRERTGVIAMLMACRQVGLVIGPGCNLFLRLVNTSIGPYPLTAYSVPGLFMASLWLLHTLLCLCLYTDFHRMVPPDNGDGDDERRRLVADGDGVGYGAVAAAGPEPEPPAVVTDRRYYVNEYLRHELVAILATIFATFFNQTALEAMLTPLTKDYLGWGELGNSLLYLGAGVEVILVFMVVRCASSRFYDSSLILLGSAVSAAAIAGMLVYFPLAVPGNELNLPMLIGSVFLDVIALPFLVTCSVSLYSKITSPATQGFSQGLRRSVIGLSTIMGPLWAGSMLTRLSIMLAVLLSLILLMMVLFCLSMPRLRCYEKAADSERRLSTTDEAAESGPETVNA